MTVATAADRRAAYAEDGYLVCPGLLASAEVADLKREAGLICRGERGQVRGIQPASAEESDDAVMARYLCIQFPHKASAHIRDAYLAHPRITEILGEIVGPNVKCMQSMLFVKHKGKPGQAWHQDEYFIPTRDRSLVGAWIALDDATIENGCLWVVPGSHKAGILWPTRPHGEDEFDEGSEAYGSPHDGEAGVPCELKAGGVLFFNGYLLHRSLKNRAASGFRRALVNHYMSAESLLPWDWDGRLPPTRDMRDVLLVRGQDPYAWKGTEDLTFAFLRAETADDPNRDPTKKIY